ncbi:aminopeptidase O-like isoform X2 [Hyalella azteca]|uniref:Aminopeptidase O-like isoform X2 n=1 Tax=Hyalella azteca TaxID=294128 RepID=A0A979FHL5_HYAAZ|nr:aminopeptidase O-like isoform X2 [Hyalella azteca]
MSSLLENHLPLSSNSSDIKASHYILCMQPDFDTKTISAKLFILCTLPIACEPMEQPGLLPKRLADSVEDNMAHGVLDMNNISIKSISLVLCDEKDLLSYWNPAIVRNNPVLTKHFFASGRNYIEFEETTWFIHFKCPRKSPFLICIEYVTSNAGVSISWREDEQGNPCFFTCGSAINNRSLLPYQDTPSALATWEAFVVVEDKYSVSMSSDGSAVDIPIDTDLLRLFNTEPFSNNFMSNCKDTKPKKCLYFYCSLSLPLATMAIAVGVWSVETLNCAKISQKEAERKMLPNCYPEDITESCLHGGTHAFNSEFVNNKDTSHPMKLPVPGLDINDVLHNNELQSSVPVSGKRSSESTSKPSGSVGNLPSSLVYPTSLSHRLEPLRQFLPHCLAAAEELLGPHPCPRLEIVVLPQSYASLGLASPNLIFLAQCIATAADSSMFLRIAHEISHAWFGIIIGAEDWTEEWLSEGFATMAEELIYEKAYRFTCSQAFENSKFGR